MNVTRFGTFEEYSLLHEVLKFGLAVLFLQFGHFVISYMVPTWNSEQTLLRFVSEDNGEFMYDVYVYFIGQYMS